MTGILIIIGAEICNLKLLSEKQIFKHLNCVW